MTGMTVHSSMSCWNNELVDAPECRDWFFDLALADSALRLTLVDLNESQRSTALHRPIENVNLPSNADWKFVHEGFSSISHAALL